MKNRKFNIIIILAIILSLTYGYYRFTSNEIIDTYNWITLQNIYITLDDIVETYEMQYNNQAVDEDEIKNNLVFREYFLQFNTYDWYLSLYPRLSPIRPYIYKMVDMDDDGISVQELEYLIKVRDKLEIYIKKINDELEEKSIRRMFGIFRKSNVDELKAVFSQDKYIMFQEGF